MDARIEHQQGRRRFVLALDGDEAELTYRREGDKIIFDHTGVPPAFQGRGIANRLAEAALAFAREQEVRVEPQCRFMAIYMKRHPEHDDLLAKP